MLFVVNIAIEQEIIMAAITIAIFIFKRVAWHTNIRSIEAK